MPDPARLNLARTHIEQGRYDQARAVLARILTREPLDPAANNLMGFTLRRLGLDAQAMFYARRALDAEPGNPGLAVNVANLLLAAGDPDNAADMYRRAIDLEPARPEARVGLTHALHARRRHHDAVPVAREGLRHAPDDPRLAAALAESLLYSGRPRDAVDALRHARAANPDNPTLARALAVASNYAGHLAPTDLLDAHRAWGRQVESAVTPSLTHPPAPDDPERPLRLGVISGDLRNQACAFFIEPILEHLDRDRFTTTCYSTCPAEDHVSRRLRDHVRQWRHVPRETPHELAAIIRRDRIDIIIDCSGHTDGNRLLALHHRPAPIQATYLGYPNTTGLTAIDLRIVDHVTDPAPAFDALAVERLLRLDPCFLCYRPPDEAPQPTRDPASAFTFGSFNNLAKMDDDAIRLWAAAMAQSPGARLLLRNHGLTTESARDEVRARLADAGIDPARLDLHPPAADSRATLAAYASMDAMLDSFPYHGTTTTCEALFMGVPVVTLMGDRSASRVGGSILRAAGCGEWAADSPEAYIHAAESLARAGPRDRAARDELRSRFNASPVRDAPAFAARLGDALRTVWRDACAATPAPAPAPTPGGPSAPRA
jgi:protein O-GlcNAc transferase